jgi:hypothetical protein
MTRPRAPASLLYRRRRALLSVLRRFPSSDSAAPNCRDRVVIDEVAGKRRGLLQALPRN